MRIHLYLVFILFCFGCTKTITAPQSFNLPEGWTQIKKGSFTLVQSPEKDLNIYFHIEAIKDLKKFDFNSRSLKLWKEIIPTFAYSELQTTLPPDKKGWDYVSQIVYKVPSEESKTILTVLRVKDNQAYINLITTSNKALSKRGAQMMTIFEGWKHPSIKDEKYTHVKVKTFGPQQSSQLDQFIESSQKELQIPAIAIGIIHDGNIIYKKGFGSHINSQTLFMIGSMTKPLTTLMTAKLVSEGILKWEDKLCDKLNNWSLKDPKATKSITMRHTACACTGMPRRDLDLLFEIENISAEHRILEMKEMNPTTKPGETFQYSNYLVAAGGFAAAHTYAPEKSLEQSYTKAMTNLVLKPLKMNNSLVINRPPYSANTAEPYILNLDLEAAPVSQMIETFPNSVAPTGSIWSNVDDILKYVQFELEEGRNISNYIKSKELLERRKKGIQIVKNMHYGLGLFIEDYKGIEIYHHGGNTMGFTANMFFVPSKKIGAVVLTNLGQINSFQSALRDKIFELLLGIESKAEEKISYTKQKLKKRNQLILKSIKPEIISPQELVGKYQSKSLGSMTITRKDNSLIADFGEFSSKLAEKDDSGQKRVFLLTGPPWNGELEIILDKGDFILDAAQQKYHFKKI